MVINRTLAERIVNVDRAYLSDEDILNIEELVNNFPLRVKTYSLLRDRGDELVLRSLHLLAEQYPEIVQKHSQKCKYDMTGTIRYISLALLRDDELFFRESLMGWYANIIHSYQIVSEISTAYRLLQVVAEKLLPADSFALVKPYIEIAISAFLKS
jgi:hypothetical protein